MFGITRKIKQIGPLFPITCHACNSSNYSVLLKTRRWIVIFWLAIIPIPKPDYFLECPNCGYSIAVDDQDEIDIAKEAVNVSIPYPNHAMATEEYWDKMETLMNRSGVVEDLKTDDSTTRERLDRGVQ